jgi:hypothetical protein
MRLAAVERAATESITIRRIVSEGVPWRVSVRSWPADHGFAGRLRFEAEQHAGGSVREWPRLLEASSREDLLDEVHRMSDERLVSLLRSLA